VELPDEEFKMPNGITIKNSEYLSFSEKFSCPISGFTIDEIEPRIFSFNSPYGACTACNGLGTEISFNEKLIVPNVSLTLREGAIHPWYQRNHRYYLQVLQGLADKYNFSLDVKFEDLIEETKLIIFNGTKGEIVDFSFDDGYKMHKVSKSFDGLMEDMSRRLNEFDDDEDQVDQYQNLVACKTCNGYRLRKESLAVKVNKLHIGEVCSMSIEDVSCWFAELTTNLTKTQIEISRLLLKEIQERLGFLRDVGLDYLTLGREAGTLSGGEGQRIRLASQIGSGLCGVMYVLDEPSIGLHQSDNSKLIATLKRLRDLGNSVIVVEHDEETMAAADYLIDIGPVAGVNGGYIVAHGTVQQVIDNPSSVTGKFLSGEDYIEVPPARRKYGNSKWLEVKNARENNLKNLDVKIPLGMFVAVTGVSGGGKSTLVIDTIYRSLAMKLNGASIKPGLHDSISGYEYVDKIIKIDQSPIGRTPRSNPATYTAVFTIIRDWFTALPESRARGYKSGRFSFNIKGGRCENCQGDGMIKIEMHFLPDVYITCDVCKGARYNRETMEIKYKGKSIADVLGMTVEDSLQFFDSIPSIKEKLKALKDVGLGYIKIGQSATTLSGGEAQRIKLAKELSKKATGNTLYILDEPTTGLHSVDIKKLLYVLHTLVDYGNTVLVIEHNLDVIKTADYVIDVGPKGGYRGGLIVAQGTPEEVAMNENSVTGEYLKKVLPKLGGGKREEDLTPKYADKAKELEKLKKALSDDTVAFADTKIGKHDIKPKKPKK
jgi:excinuclease ABC subunit A